MAGPFRNLFKRERADVKDARVLYRALMTQSRNPVFYGKGKIPDSYDGRIDFLTLHLAIVMNALRRHEDNGERLSQALYDVMIDDFDVALREEGLSDTGVVRRIKPMANLFFSRVKAYSDAFEKPVADMKPVIRNGNANDMADIFLDKLVNYIADLRAQLSGTPLGQIARADFVFPEFS